MEIFDFKTERYVHTNDVNDALDVAVTDLEKLEIVRKIIAYRKGFLRHNAQEQNFTERYALSLMENDHILNYCNTELELLNEICQASETTTTKQPKKIKWNGSPALFGYLFSEFGANDFIQVPVHNGEMNVSQYARDLWEHFEIDTTLGNLTKELGNSSLSDTKRAKFPDFKDLS